MYGLDQSWYGERDHLNSLAELFDETTLTWCEQSGLRPGIHVLELRAGAGSIAAAMADRAGPGGRVVAVDPDTRFLLGHLGEPLPVLRTWIEVLKPGKSAARRRCRLQRMRRISAGLVRVLRRPPCYLQRSGASRFRPSTRPPFAEHRALGRT